jgi:hypothetical protein
MKCISKKLFEMASKKIKDSGIIKKTKGNPAF